MTLERFLQFENAYGFTTITESGILTEYSEFLFSNKLFPNSFTSYPSIVSGIITTPAFPLYFVRQAYSLLLSSVFTSYTQSTSGTA